ncbi:MAG: hypothetical protein H6Q78_373 [Candidatus Krumholzibacteriota bacterium]|nr:hypothetical protein [Candidatus Krumholzibacteriota bacterium]
MPGPALGAGIPEKVEAVLKRVSALFLLAAVPVLAAALGARGAMDGGKGERIVQIVYESDTRGYYLPCG